MTAQGGLAQAEVAFLAGLASGSTYLNIHTSSVPGGEIRGFPQATPEPATMLLFTASRLGLGFVRRQTRG